MKDDDSGSRPEWRDVAAVPHGQSLTSGLNECFVNIETSGVAKFFQHHRGDFQLHPIPRNFISIFPE